MICQGITTKSTPCKNRAIANKNYCRCHGPPIPVTPVIEGWISSSEVEIPNSFIKDYSTAFYHIHSAVMESSKITDNTDDVSRGRRRYLFFKVTLILMKCTALLKTTDSFQRIIDMCIIKMESHPHLNEYCEYFARKLSVRHREEAKKRFANSIITESILGQDIAGVIVGFM